jgi:hypothetical protein
VKHEHIGAMSLFERQHTFPVQVVVGLSPVSGGAKLHEHVSPKTLVAQKILEQKQPALTRDWGCDAGQPGTAQQRDGEPTFEAAQAAPSTRPVDAVSEQTHSVASDAPQ